MDHPGYDNRISLQKLEVFCCVVDLGGVTRAAEHLFVAQPVVTAHVRSLEERLGTRLLYRDGRRMRLTESGERVYAWASETLARTRELAREIDGLSDGHRGAIVIAAEMSLGSYLLPPFLARFLARRPQADITVHISDPEQAIAETEAGACDLALVGAESPTEGSPLAWELLGGAQIVLVAAPHGEPSSSSVAVAELETLPLVVSTRGDFRRAVVDRQLQRVGVEPRNIAIRLGHSEAIKRAVQAGLGAALLLRSAVVHELQAGSLREVAIADASLSVPIYVVRRSDKRLTPIQQELLDALRSGLQTELQALATATDDEPPAADEPDLSA